MSIVPYLIVDEYGSFVGKKSERLCVTCQGAKRVEAPLMHLESVLITGKGVSLSSDAVAACAEAGIPIYFLDSLGRPVGSFYSSSLTATIETRRAQLAARDDSRAVAIAKAVAAGKIRNQANLLKYLSKNRREKQPDVFESVRLLSDEVLDHLAELERIQGDHLDPLRGQLLSVEGRAAQKYWDGIKQLLLVANDWPGRRTQGATDPVNSALNYGYGILYGHVERSLVLAGLDPYAGFLHVDRPGKASLVFDMVEEFRQTVVDRTVVAIVNRGTEIALDERGRLADSTRRYLAEKVLERLDAAEPFEGKRHLLRNIIQMQARRLVTYLRQERAQYEAFVASW